MESTRQKKVASLLLREINAVFQTELTVLPGVLLTINHVYVTPDLQIARFYLTCLPEAKLPAVLTSIEEQQKKIRYLLAARIRNHFKMIPTLEFYEDETMKVAARMDALFAEIHAKDSNKNGIN
ncbi:MAG: 30S ribosome-binding factor RbfA [Bacteroidia bacterium]|nr:30S ribosome-binding factor RbfA [Bacteroidia bacterium]